MQWLHALQLLTDRTLRSTKKFLMLEIPSHLAALSHGLSGERDKPKRVSARDSLEMAIQKLLCPLATSTVQMLGTPLALLVWL